MVNATHAPPSENQAVSVSSPGALPDLPAIRAEIRALLNEIPRGRECSLAVEHRVSEAGEKFDCSVHHDSLRFLPENGGYTNIGVDTQDHRLLVDRARRLLLPQVNRALRVQEHIDAAITSVK